MQDSDSASRLARMTKIDLHRHLEGSLRLSSLQELARSGAVDLPSDPDKLRSLVTMIPGDARTPQTLLNKFQHLRRVYTSPELIQRFVFEAVEDAAADRVIHLELRFSPLALVDEKEFPVPEVMDWVIEAAGAASVHTGISVRLIASVNRHESLDQASVIAEAAVDRKGKILVGFDLAGDEEYFSADQFQPLFREAGETGLFVTLHAGEWSGAHAVRQAVESFHADRIGHGVRVVEDAEVLALVRERNIPFEVCPLSNIYSGAAGSWTDHPLREMILSGLFVTVNTDNPGILGTTLAMEAAEMIEHTDLSIGTMQAVMLNAARAAFLPETMKRSLEERLLEDYNLACKNPSSGDPV